MLTNKQINVLRRAPVKSRNKLWLAMLLSGVTQEEITAKTGVSQGFLSRIKNDRYGELRLDDARTLAAFFGCGIDDMFPEQEHGNRRVA